MAASLMLRDERERITGYVLLFKDRLYARMDGDGEAAALTVLAEQGTATELSLVCDAQEHILPFKDGGMTAAYVSRKGELLASTCPAAREAFHKTIAAAEKRREKNVETCKKEAADSVYTERKQEPAWERASIRSGLQARWPPPPCWPTARYVGGAFTEGGV